MKTTQNMAELPTLFPRETVMVVNRHARALDGFYSMGKLRFPCCRSRQHVLQSWKISNSASSSKDSSKQSSRDGVEVASTAGEAKLPRAVEAVDAPAEKTTVSPTSDVYS